MKDDGSSSNGIDALTSKKKNDREAHITSSGCHGKAKGPEFELGPLDLADPHSLFYRQCLPTSPDCLFGSLLPSFWTRSCMHRRETSGESRLIRVSDPLCGSTPTHLPCGEGLDPTGQQQQVPSMASKEAQARLCASHPRCQPCCEGTSSVP